MKDNLVYVRHMIDAIRSIHEYIEGMSFNDFIKDKKTLDAVIRQIEILGEASNKCSVEFKKEHSNLPWREMSDARNKMIHDYMGVSVEIVWGICQKELPDLLKELELVLN